jgi:FkbM family methyltransferase
MKAKTFIEIGTSDFDTLLPLAKQGWKGIFVEPVKYLLDNIERLENCEYVNAAIATRDGTTTINYVENPTEEWLRGIGYTSEHTQYSEYFWNNDFEAKSEEVDCMRMDTLIKRYGVTEIDFLKMDIEGLELKIIEDYSWNIKPKILKIECAHWEIKDVDNKNVNVGALEKTIAQFQEMGYIIYKDSNDLYGFI